MTSHETAQMLLSLPDTPLTVFAEGKCFPVLQVQLFEGVVEIGCGWAEKEGLE